MCTKNWACVSNMCRLPQRQMVLNAVALSDNWVYCCETQEVGKWQIGTPLQNQFWRAPTMGLVWSLPLRQMAGHGQTGGGGKRIIGGGGPDPFLGRSFMVIFDPPLSSPPPLLLSKKSGMSPECHFRVTMLPVVALYFYHRLSGPLRLKVQSLLRRRSRIAACIAFWVRACFHGVSDTIAPLSRARRK